mgnify:CR=1 FL=1
MKFSSEPLVILPEVGSTQDVLRQRLVSGESASGVMAYHQSQGRGRFDRSWHSAPGDSLTVSLAFPEYANHPTPWLIGQAVALAVAATLRTQVMWPNDLTIAGRKVGGILSEMVSLPNGDRVPIVGVGVNLNQTEFPEEIAHRATSLYLARGFRRDPEETAQQIINALHEIPEPRNWSDLQSMWNLFDDTAGKVYVLPDGQKATSIGLGPDGCLVASLQGETIEVRAADADYGPDPMAQAVGATAP